MTFKEEIEAAIDDIIYGVDDVKILNDHPISDNVNVVLLKVQSKEKQILMVRMSMIEGFKVMELQDINENILKDDKIHQPFDSLPNLLMNYSELFQQSFQQQLFSRLIQLQNK